MTMMAILIDPYEETIEVVDYSGDYKDISTLLGCDLFTSVYTEMADTIYVDDEGLYVENQKYFKLKGYPQPLAGRGLVIGVTDDGDSTDCVSSLEDIQDMVSWCPEGTHVEPIMEVMGLSADDQELMTAMAERYFLETAFGKKAIN
jgi:hypothetical protein